MIRFLGTAPATGRIHQFQTAAAIGAPMGDGLVLAPRIGEGAAAPMGGWDLDPSPADPEARLEAALIAEWEAFSAPPETEFENTILGILDEGGPAALLIRSDTGDRFGTAIVRGRAAMIRTWREIRASCRFGEVKTGVAEGVAVSILPAHHAMPVFASPREPGISGPWAARLDAECGIPHSAWIDSPDGPRLVDVGGPIFDLCDPWASVMSGEEGAEAQAPAVTPAASRTHLLEQRVMLGRMYNRLLRPARPMAWVDLLGEDAGHASTFCNACAALHPGLGERLLDLARSSAAEERTLTGTAANPAALQAIPGPPAIRQVIGRPGAPGEASGTVGQSVLICDHVGSAHAENVRGAVAIVERKGAGFGLGAILARRHGIPHVYRIPEAAMIPPGTSVHVNGHTGIITIPSQL